MTGKQIGWIAAMLASIAVAFFALSDRGYGEISPTGYQYATALYAACNQKDSEKLNKLSALIDRSQVNEEISAEEGEWLFAIIEQGHGGQWESAADEVRQLMRDQVKGI